MLFIETKLRGLYAIEPAASEDERGSFARTYCAREFEQHGLDPVVAQCSISWNRRAATLRGMHYQDHPAAEKRLVRCERGSIFDVAVDLRPESETYCEWFGQELSQSNRLMHFITEGFAHGFITLEDDSEVFYQMSEYYSPEHARGVRWDDPAFGIAWPMEPGVISPRDASYPDFVREET